MNRVLPSVARLLRGPFWLLLSEFGEGKLFSNLLVYNASSSFV